MNTKIKIDGNLQGIIKEALQETRNVTGDSMRAAIDKTAKQAVEQTRENAPVRTGVYKKSWKNSVTMSTSAAYERTVYVKEPHYRRTHLLQNGHAVRPVPKSPGKRSFVSPRPHIMTDEEVDSFLEANLMEELKK